MEKQVKINYTNGVGELSAAIVKQSVDDYEVFNKRLNKAVQKLKKQKRLQVELKEQRKTQNKIKRMRREIKRIVQFLNSEWYIFLTNISRTKIKEIIKDVYVNTWGLNKKSYGYLCLEENLMKKGV
jgi:hypothetical protein